MYADDEFVWWQPAFDEPYVQAQIVKKVEGTFYDVELNLHHHKYVIKRFIDIATNNYEEVEVFNFQLVKEWRDT